MWCMKEKTLKGKELPILILILSAGLVLRVCLRLFTFPYPEVMKDWAALLFEDGFSSFYSHESVQWPYPPLYLYVLWLMQAFVRLFGAAKDTGFHELIIQLPPILCDIAAAAFLWKESSRRISPRSGLLAAALWCFNPAVIHNSSVWGQTDACFCLFIALMCAAFSEKKLFRGFLYFGISLMLKQQSLSFAPLVLIALAERYRDERSLRALVKPVLQGLAVIAGMILISLPFGLGGMLSQYLSVQSGMSGASIDAFNFWTLIGRNWAPIDNTFLHISIRTWGNAALAAVTLLSFLLAFFQSKKSRTDYPLLAAFLILNVFCFGTCMHERYMFAGPLFLLLARSFKPKKSTLLFFIAFSLLQFANTFVIYEYNLGFFGESFPKEKVQLVLSFCVVAATLLLDLLLLLPYLPHRNRKDG